MKKINLLKSILGFTSISSIACIATLNMTSCNESNEKMDEWDKKNTAYKEWNDQSNGYFARYEIYKTADLSTPVSLDVEIPGMIFMESNGMMIGSPTAAYPETEFVIKAYVNVNGEIKTTYTNNFTIEVKSATNSITNHNSKSVRHNINHSNSDIEIKDFKINNFSITASQGIIMSDEITSHIVDSTTKTAILPTFTVKNQTEAIDLISNPELYTNNKVKWDIITFISFIGQGLISQDMCDGYNAKFLTFERKNNTVKVNVEIDLKSKGEIIAKRYFYSTKESDETKDVDFSKIVQISSSLNINVPLIGWNLQHNSSYIEGQEGYQHSEIFGLSQLILLKTTI